MQICSIGLLCGNEIRRTTCLPPSSQGKEATSTQTHTVPTSGTSVSSIPPARATQLWAIVNT
ncbi:hypothetical protein DBR06_SOUSAS31710002, partial [Sousa chinensis]